MYGRILFERLLELDGLHVAFVLLYDVLELRRLNEHEHQVLLVVQGLVWRWMHVLSRLRPVVSLLQLGQLELDVQVLHEHQGRYELRLFDR